MPNIPPLPPNFKFKKKNEDIKKEPQKEKIEEISSPQILSSNNVSDNVSDNVNNSATNNYDKDIKLKKQVRSNEKRKKVLFSFLSAICFAVSIVMFTLLFI